jgi:hypothetical protein
MNSKASLSDDNVLLTLSRAQALTLFEFLARYGDRGCLEIHDQAEQRVLWDMCCGLQRVLEEPLRDDYKDLLQRARDAVRDAEETEIL